MFLTEVASRSQHHGLLPLQRLLFAPSPHEWWFLGLHEDSSLQPGRGENRTEWSAKNTYSLGSEYGPLLRWKLGAAPVSLAAQRQQYPSLRSRIEPLWHCRLLPPDPACMVTNSGRNGIWWPFCSAAATSAKPRTTAAMLSPDWDSPRIVAMALLFT